MKTTLSVWLCLLAAVTAPLSDATTGHFSVSVPSEPISVWLGDAVVLPCTVTPSMDARDLELRWYRPQKFNMPLLHYKEHQLQTSSLDPRYRDRVSLEHGTEALARGNLSLRLRNITAADPGEYVCYVSSDQWYEKGQVSLHLNNLVGSPLVLSVQPSNGDRGGAQPQVNVTCVSEGWFPKPTLTWRDSKGTEVKDQQGVYYSTDAQGLVSVTGWLLYSPSDSEWLSCSVSLSQGDSREGRVLTHIHAPSGWMAAFISLLVLILLSAIIIITVLLVRSRRRGRKESKGNAVRSAEGDVSPEEMKELMAKDMDTEVQKRDLEDMRKKAGKI
ncbi:hypothetical protein MATL_G00263050 [Megalops atlanticus]|uniref:Ig-like domain-containing protein n=1 Tax=Megalops atlanticus TaxID=7932 RepID=A0A9D3PDG7_MEGAT|nr:hypothetical protein MATL_G00263050 [Megalops atlanticus]